MSSSTIRLSDFTLNGQEGIIRKHLGRPQEMEKSYLQVVVAVVRSTRSGRLHIVNGQYISAPNTAVAEKGEQPSLTRRTIPCLTHHLQSARK